MTGQKRQGWNLYVRESMVVMDPLQLRPDTENPGKAKLYPPGTYKIQPRPVPPENWTPLPEGYVYIPDQLLYCPNCGADIKFLKMTEPYESPHPFYYPTQLKFDCGLCGTKKMAYTILDFNSAIPDKVR